MVGKAMNSKKKEGQADSWLNSGRRSREMVSQKEEILATFLSESGQHFRKDQTK